MKAGLFMCDHVDPQYRDRYGNYWDKFQNLFPEFDFTIYDVCNGEFPKSLDECGVYLATGSRYSVYDKKDWIIQLKKVIQELYDQNKYFLGFCFGHQLIGEALGGRVAKSPKGWCVGVHTFEAIKSKSWMIPKAREFNLLMMCQDQIIDLPEDTQVLAGSEKCPYGMIQVGERFLGIQAHPEFSKAYDRILMESRMNKMGDDVALAGIETLSQDVHSNLIRNWILGFINIH